MWKHRCRTLLFNNACNFIKKKTMAQVFFCEFCEIFKNKYFIEHLQTTASAGLLIWDSFHYLLRYRKMECTQVRSALSNGKLNFIFRLKTKSIYFCLSEYEPERLYLLFSLIIARLRGTSQIESMHLGKSNRNDILLCSKIVRFSIGNKF